MNNTESYKHKPSEESRNSAEYEQEPIGRVSLEGIALVRRDLGDIEEDLSFDFADKVSVITATGSRPWCVVEPRPDVAWREVLDSIPLFDYLVHSMTIRVNSMPESVAISEVRNKFRDLLAQTVSYDDYSLFVTRDQFNVVMNRVHLDVLQASKIMIAAESVCADVVKSDSDTRDR